MNLLVEGKNFILKCARVWLITRKPTKEEFKLVTKAAALGVLLIGLIGFLISMIVGFFIPK